MGIPCIGYACSDSLSFLDVRTATHHALRARLNISCIDVAEDDGRVERCKILELYVRINLTVYYKFELRIPCLCGGSAVSARAIAYRVRACQGAPCSCPMHCPLVSTQLPMIFAKEMRLTMKCYVLCSSWGVPFSFAPKTAKAFLEYTLSGLCSAVFGIYRIKPT